MEAVLEDYRTAPISEQLKAMLGLVEKLTLHPEEVQPEDMQALSEAGVSEQAILSAVYVSVLFAVYNRMADSLHFAVPPRKSFNFSAKMLLRVGYE